jgi:monoterpene epsilon-lactone hydrolase
VLPGPNAVGGTILFLHGGGYALGSAKGYRGVAAHLADAAGMQALIPEHSRSPECSYPKALEEMVAVYIKLLGGGLDPQRTVVAGDSAGGGLTLAVGMALRVQGLPLPAALGLICPWIDLVADVMGTRVSRRDPLTVPKMTAEWAAPYAGSWDPALPGISPVYGDVSGLPPIVMHSSGDDPIAADADKLDSAFIATPNAGDLDHRRYDNLWHDFHLQVSFLAVADAAVADMGVKLRAYVSTTDEVAPENQ